MKNNIILRVYIICYDFLLLNKTVGKIINLAVNNSIKFKGPITLPSRIERFNLLRSPHVNKKSRDQLELVTHKKFIDFFNFDVKTITLLRDCIFFFCLDFKFKFLFKHCKW